MKNSTKEAFRIVFVALLIFSLSYAIIPNAEPCTTIYPDTCAVCRNHIDTTKDNAMMMYINGDFISRDEVEKAYERRIKLMSKKH